MYFLLFVVVCIFFMCDDKDFGILELILLCKCGCLFKFGYVMSDV